MATWHSGPNLGNEVVPNGSLQALEREDTEQKPRIRLVCVGRAGLQSDCALDRNPALLW